MVKQSIAGICARYALGMVLALSAVFVQAAILGVDGPLIYRIDETTGASTLLTTGSSPTGAVSMAKNSAGVIYVAADNGTGFPRLYTVDPVTGIATAGPALGLSSVTFTGLAFNSADVLYATTGTTTLGLYTLNTTTGVATFVGVVNGAISALEFSPGDTLYGWEPGATGRGLVTINPATAAITDVNPAVGDAGTNIQTLAFSSAGVLYGARTSLYTIDPATGTPTLVAAFNPATTIFGMEFVAGGPPAPVVSLSPPSLTFGNQQVGTTSAAQALTLQNSGTAVLNIASIAASGDFAQSNTCGATLAATASCIINVTFTPTVAGARSGAITVTSNAAGSPHSVGLSGTGTAVPPPPPPPPVSTAPIPTLSQWALMLLALLVGGMGWAATRRKPRTGPPAR